MNCYSRQEWLNYCRHLIERNTEEEMERHLESCDQCLEIYLSVLEESAPGYMDTPVPREFADKVMHKISINTVRTVKKQVQKPAQVFTYYAVAASLTLMLSLSGFFQFISDTLPKASYSLANSSVIIGNAMTNTLPEKLADKTQTLFDQIHFNRYKE